MDRSSVLSRAYALIGDVSGSCGSARDVSGESPERAAAAGMLQKGRRANCCARCTSSINDLFDQDPSVPGGSLTVSQQFWCCADTANFASILTVLQVSQPISSLKDLTSRNGAQLLSHTVSFDVQNVFQMRTKNSFLAECA